MAVRAAARVATGAENAAAAEVTAEAEMIEGLGTGVEAEAGKHGG